MSSLLLEEVSHDLSQGSEQDKIDWKGMMAFNSHIIMAHLLGIKSQSIELVSKNPRTLQSSIRILWRIGDVEQIIKLFQLLFILVPIVQPTKIIDIVIDTIQPKVTLSILAVVCEWCQWNLQMFNNLSRKNIIYNLSHETFLTPKMRYCQSGNLMAPRSPYQPLP